MLIDIERERDVICIYCKRTLFVEGFEANCESQPIKIEVRWVLGISRESMYNKQLQEPLLQPISDRNTNTAIGLSESKFSARVNKIQQGHLLCYSESSGQIIIFHQPRFP